MWSPWLLALSSYAADREVLPLIPPWREPITTVDARDAEAPPVFRVEAPAGAPNVVIVLIDDLGFGGTSTFGGVIPTPTFDTLAEGGIRYNQFHSTALCSPTRTAMLTGRNHHSVNMGSITESATSFPGQTGILPEDAAMLPEILQLNGWSTAHFGKDHMTPAWETSPSGPFTRWPTQRGFDVFYGFLGGETNQYSPTLYDGTTPVEDPGRGDPDYHFLTDMTDRAIQWIGEQQGITPDKPFFVYYAPGAVHAPHHVPREYVDKYAGKFDEGWDVVRKRIHEQQLDQGIIPKGTRLADKPEDIADWSKLSDDEQRLFARQAEVFAAYVDMTDHEIGRLIDAIDDLGELENTLVLYIAGDNGTSAEGGMAGMYNESTYFNLVEESVADMLEHYDEWGGPSTYPHMAAGWAVAFDAPFMWTKQVASNYGGTRQGMVVHWPAGIESSGQLRDQWHHVIDLTPTVLEAAGLPQPTIVNGVGQRPMEGVSMVYSFDQPDAADRHLVQYFEMFGNRGIYVDGWFAGTVHQTPWGQVENPLADDTWELYHVEEDFSMSRDLAKRRPEKLEELQSVFLAEAVKHRVLPIDDRRQLRLNATLAGRPQLYAGRDTVVLPGGTGPLLENAFPDVKNRSFQLTARVEANGPETRGVVVAQGGRFGGWSLHVVDGAPVYSHNLVGMETTVVRSDAVLPQGEATITMDFDYDGGEPGSGGTATLFIDGEQVARGRIEATHCCLYSLDESSNVGIDRETMVTPEVYEGPDDSRFTGTIHDVTITLEDAPAETALSTP